MRLQRATILKLLLTVISMMTAATTFGAALTDEAIEQLKTSGEFDAYLKRLAEWREQGMDSPDGRLITNDRFALSTEAVTHKVLVILIDFSDKPYTAGFAAPEAADFDSLLFSDGLNPTGSMKEFYIENSYGNYIIQGTVVGWYHDPLGYADYSGNNGFLTPPDLVRNAVRAADAEVDFSDYDNNGDNYVEGVIIVHAGTGAEESGNIYEIHSHMSSLMPAEPVDGVWVNRYTIQPEESAGNQSMSGIGVFCHEWGHILGLPDLYDTDYSTRGVGRWSLMGSGNYNNSSRSPSHFDVWCKQYLGWITPVNLQFNAESVSLPAIEHNQVAYRLNKNGIWSSEYWLIENRYQTGFDSYIPGHGLMIYHINENVSTNSNDDRPLVRIEEADGRFDLRYNGNSGDISDPWPFEDKHEFHDKTIPDSRYYVSLSSQVGVWNISAADSVMTADLEVAFSRPWVEIGSMILRDNIYGNGNNTPEAGERIQVIATLLNEWATATGIEATMRSDDPTLDIVVATSTFPDLETEQSGSNINVPFEFVIPSEYESRIDSFYFDITSNGGEYAVTVAGEAPVGKPQILIVDDDDGDPDNLQNYFYTPLYNKRTPSAMWIKKLQGSPTVADLNDYPIVLWLTGVDRSHILSPDDLNALKWYLDSGGNLFLSGQGLAEFLTVQDPVFLNDYLKASFYDNYAMNSSVVIQSADGPAFGGMSQIVLTGTPGPANQTVANHLLPVNGGVSEFEYYRDPVTSGAISYNGAYRSVFFTFGFEAIKSNDPRFETQTTIMSAIIDFFGDLPTDVEDESDMAINLPTQLRLGQNYPNPFNPVTTITYTITGSGGRRVERTKLDVYNVMGQHVATLVDRDQSPGQYTVTWDGRDSAGQEVASGLYFYRLVRSDLTQTRKMILLK